LHIYITSEQQKFRNYFIKIIENLLYFLINGKIIKIYLREYKE